MRDRIKKAGLREVHFLANVHDSWVIDTVEDNIPALKEMIVDVFKNPSTKKNFGFEFKCPMDVEIGVSSTNWLEMETIYPEE